MRIMFTFIASLTWAMLAARCSATHTTLWYRGGEVPRPPSQDPFYSAPAGYEDKAPGTILRVRLAPGNLTTMTGNCSTVFNIVYRTTNSRYEPSWAVTTLFTPSSPSGNGSVLLSYQIPYNSADVDASPSYSLYNNAGRPADIAAALGRGWYVNVPDFEGPSAAFALGVQEGHATLDSVRAVLHPQFALDKNTRYAMWGYSGGSIASEWAAELQVQYAPELSFAGAALGGLIPNLTNSVEAVTGTVWAGLMPPGLLGVTSQNQEAHDFLLGALKTSGPYNRTTFLSAYNLNLTQSLEVFADQNIFEYLDGGNATFFSPTIQNVFDSDGLMSYHGVPQMPLFFYKAIADEIAPVRYTDDLVRKYCDVGVSILYQRNEIGGHVAEETNGDARAFEWLSGVLDGTSGLKTPSVGCTIENVAVNVTDSPL